MFIKDIRFNKGIKTVGTVLAGVAQLVGHCSANQKVADLIPGQGICLGCGFGPLLGMCKRQLIHVSLSHPCFSPSLSPSLPPL